MQNLDSQEIDDLPFREALLKTCEKKWGGILRVLKEGEQIGSVFMRDGQVAWAVSNNQTENFGSFLERIGLIPKEKLNEIASKYKALGKSKKLGTLIEEEGLISRAKLRECLRAHIRAAIGSMMDDTDVVIKASHGEMIVDANLMFLLNEVLPGHYGTGETADARFAEPVSTEPVPAETVFAEIVPVEHAPAEAAPEFAREWVADPGVAYDLLGSLASLPGYLFSLLAGADGKLLALHKAEGLTDAAGAPDAAIAWINALVAAAANGPFGRVECLTLEHEGGLLIAQWADSEGLYFVGGSFDKEGKLGVIKHKVAEIIPPIRQYISESTG
ncbi:MAG TPA: hypothetical protein VMJ66_03670 [Geobacteraceae bacterium]|nr:hypothetical protein [Geobacteraceae bacterium]